MKRRGIFCLLCALLLTHVNTHGQQWDWVQRFSGDGTVGTEVGVDDAQNVYVAGTFTGTNYIGTNRIASDSGHNLFFAKFDPFGVPLWTITAMGVLTKMLVTSNGSVFVCGALTFNNSASKHTISNVFIARLDDGNVIWAEPLPEDVVPGGLAFGPDETLYVLAATNQAFVRRYKQGGALLSAILIQREPFTPLAVTVGPNEELYVMGRYSTNWPYIVDFIAPISPTGEMLWTWSPGASAYNWDYHVQGIAATPDGGVVSVGFHYNSLPQSWAFVVKHSLDGTQEWKTGVAGYFKAFFSADAVTVGEQGKIYVTGYAAGSYYNAPRLLMLTLSPTGEHLSDERIASYIKGHGNNGKDIAVDKDGAVIVTGTLEGQTIFGTNRLSYASRNGFVARRSTIIPALTHQQVGNDVILSWPATALPFALQQSTDGTNWSFVTVAPARNIWRNQTVLPASAGTTFRLFRTNEVPVPHPPRIHPLYSPGVLFLDHERVVIIGFTNTLVSRAGVYYQDEDENPLTVTWTNLQTSAPMTNGILVTRYPGRDEWRYHDPSYYGASVALDASMFAPGRHSVSVSVSDGTFTVTQNYPEFEVISSEMAVSEFVSALNALNGDRTGRQAIAFWEAWLRANDREREKLAEHRWVRFQRQLQRVSSLSEEERGKLSSAVEQVKPLLQSQ